MERKQASDYPQELLDLFHEYQHGDITRRAFLDGAAKFAVGGLTVAAIFEGLDGIAVLALEAGLVAADECQGLALCYRIAPRWDEFHLRIIAWLLCSALPALFVSSNASLGRRNGKRMRRWSTGNPNEAAGASGVTRHSRQTLKCAGMR